MEFINAFIDWGNKNSGATSLIGAIITMVATIIAVVAIVVTSFHASRSYRQAKESDIEKNRPVVLANISYSVINDAVLLRIQNIGATVAKNVQIKFDDSFMHVAENNNGSGFMNHAYLLLQKYNGVQGQDWWAGRDELDYYSRRPPAPGSVQTYKGVISDRISPPQVCSVTITYSSNYNREEHLYKDVYILDLSALTGSPTLIVKDYETHLVENVKTIHREISARNKQGDAILRIGSKVINVIDEIKDELLESKFKAPTKNIINKLKFWGMN